MLKHMQTCVFVRAEYWVYNLIWTFRSRSLVLCFSSLVTYSFLILSL